MYMIDYFED